MLRSRGNSTGICLPCSARVSRKTAACVTITSSTKCEDATQLSPSEVSARRATRATAALTLPPNHIGGRGFWTDFWASDSPSAWKKLPSKSTVCSDHRRCMRVTPSMKRPKRRLCVTPMALNSSSVQPGATPRISLPPETISSSEACSMTCSGW